MKLKLSKVEWILIILFIMLYIGDFISTILGWNVAQHLESNPLYLLTGTLLVPVIYNLVILCAIIWLYYKGSITSRFFSISIVCWVSLLRVVAITSNVKGYLNPPSLEAAKAVTTAAKVKFYSSISIAFLIFIAVSQIIFFIFKLGHNIQIKKRENKKKK